MSQERTIEEMLKKRSSTPPDELGRCPNCGWTNFHVKTTHFSEPRESPEPYHCRNCGTHFEEPVTRQ